RIEAIAALPASAGARWLRVDRQSDGARVPRRTGWPLCVPPAGDNLDGAACTASHAIGRHHRASSGRDAWTLPAEHRLRRQYQQRVHVSRGVALSLSGRVADLGHGGALHLHALVARACLHEQVASAGGGNRTRTLLSEPRILSPVRLPVSPPRRGGIS